MSKNPAVLFYTSEFLAGTSFFTDEQRGQYIRLLCEQHQSGHIPEAHIREVCKIDNTVVIPPYNDGMELVSPVLAKFVRDEKGSFYNVRMEKEILRRSNFSNTQRDNVLKRWKKNQVETPITDEDTAEDTTVYTRVDTPENTAVIPSISNNNTSSIIISNDNPNIKTKEEKKVRNKNKIEVFDFAFVEKEWAPLFFEWLEYKKKRREYYKTQQSVEACYRNLKAFSGNSVKVGRRVVDQATGNNWMGLQPLKNVTVNSSNAGGMPYKTYTYEQMMFKLDRAGSDAKFWKDYKEVQLPGMPAKVWVHINDAAIHGL